MSKEIELTQGQITIIDDEDYDFLSQWKWKVSYDTHTKSYRAMRNENKKVVFMHRIIMNTPANLIVDHINHDTLDNRKQNLRNVTQSQNSMNRIIKPGITGEKGIIVHGKKFRVRIRKEKKQYEIGLFKTIADAKIAYDNAIKEIFGDFRLK